MQLINLHTLVFYCAHSRRIKSLNGSTLQRSSSEAYFRTCYSLSRTFQGGTVSLGNPLPTPITLQDRPCILRMIHV